MKSIDRLLAELPERPSPEALLREFVPPARFASKSFENYEPQHPTQAAARDRLKVEVSEMEKASAGGLLSRMTRRFRSPAGGGLYLDGSFGVGKTHLLAAFWNAAPGPKAYLSFDELVYFLGLVGVAEGRAAFSGQRLVAIDEWELDDPGNLKLALAFLRGAVASGVRLAVTSNTLPLDLGGGRFSQKDFRAEIEELAGAFQVIRMEGDDFRHRHFESQPGTEYFLAPERLEACARAAGEEAVLVPFSELLQTLSGLHPIRYAALVGGIGALHVRDLAPITRLPEALRWVHFVDKLYDSATPFAASAEIALVELFPESFRSGPFAKKFSRCLSRMEELLGESQRASITE